jgi:hypothetical protein
MPDRLSALDATFLELEQMDEGATMHIGGVMVFDSLPGGKPPTLEAVRSDIASRLLSLGRYSQRLSSDRVGGLSWPRWQADPQFDLCNHVRRAALPAPGGDAQLCEWSADFFSHRLDRTRPLWELVLVEGLEQGRWALAMKTHHSLVDGVGSVDVVSLMLGAEPAPPAARSRSVAELIVRDEVIGAPRSSLNVAIGSARRYGIVRASLAELKAIGHELEGSVNDVVLAACTAGLRRLLLSRREDPPLRGLRAMVPMNVRKASERLGLGNRVSSLFVELPVSEPDPLARLQEIVAHTRWLKSSRAALGADTMIDLSGLAPPLLHAMIARALYATRLFNLTITNVPGPRVPLYAFGAPLREVHPLVPLAAEHALGVAIISCGGGVVLGLSADRDSTPDFDVFVDGVREGFAELRTLGPASGARRPHRTAKLKSAKLGSPLAVVVNRDEFVGDSGEPHEPERHTHRGKARAGAIGS